MDPEIKTQETPQEQNENKQQRKAGRPKNRTWTLTIYGKGGTTQRQTVTGTNDDVLKDAVKGIRESGIWVVASGKTHVTFDIDHIVITENL